MAATMKTAISPFRQPKTEPNANSIDFLDEDLALVPASGIPEEFAIMRKQCGLISAQLHRGIAGSRGAACS
jgi:hypothetical protein